MKNVYIAGHNGMVGNAIKQKLSEDKNINLIFEDKANLNLISQEQCNLFFANKKIDEVYLCAAKVGGIYSNNAYPADFISANLAIQQNIINAAYSNNISRLLFLGSSCIYPRNCPQPIKEEYLLTGPLEKTNEPYAIAKIAGIKLCESFNRQFNTDFRSVMPTNLYGENDNFDLKNSHVIPALLRKFHEAKIQDKKFVEIWGSGKPKREFLNVDDLADACIYVMSISKEKLSKYLSPQESHINIGCGSDLTIKELALLIKEVVGYKGDIEFNHDMPDGTMKKRLCVEKINKLGWKAKINLREGLSSTYNWYVKNTQNSINQKNQ